MSDDSNIVMATIQKPGDSSFQTFAGYCSRNWKLDILSQRTARNFICSQLHYELSPAAVHPIELVRRRMKQESCVARSREFRRTTTTKFVTFIRRHGLRRVVLKMVNVWSEEISKGCSPRKSFISFLISTYTAHQFLPRLSLSLPDDISVVSLFAISFRSLFGLC